MLIVLVTVPDLIGNLKNLLVTKCKNCRLSELLHSRGGNVSLFGRLVGLPLYLSRLKISRAVEWITMGFCADIHSLQRMNAIDFGDPLTFYLVLHLVFQYFATTAN